MRFSVSLSLSFTELQAVCELPQLRSAAKQYRDGTPRGFGDKTISPKVRGL